MPDVISHGVTAGMRETLEHLLSAVGLSETVTRFIVVC
jgi:hypothetical protein